MKQFMIVGLIFLTDCASPFSDTTVVSLLNNRIANLEQKLQTNPPGVKNLPDRSGNLTEAQKEFIRVMMDYLGEQGE
jgi:hypothetical protein